MWKEGSIFLKCLIELTLEAVVGLKVWFVCMCVMEVCGYIKFLYQEYLDHFFFSKLCVLYS